MKPLRAPLVLAALALASLGATGCHRHHLARMYRAEAPPPVYYASAHAQAPIVIVIENGGATTVDYAGQDAAARDEAMQKAAAREEAIRRARIERERARIEQERARIEHERAEREAQARAAAAGRTTVIVVTPSGAHTVPAEAWFNPQ